MPLKFTKHGWYDTNTGKSICAEMSINKDGQMSYAIVPEDPSTLTQMFWFGGHKPEFSDVPSCGVMLNLVWNIARGQRATTPKYQNQFIDRYDKTFFRDGYRFALFHSQDHVTNISALGNYVMITASNSACGAIESIYEGYMHLLGNIAYTLYKTLYADNPDVSTEEIVKDKRTLMSKISFTPARLEEIKRVIDCQEAAIEVVQGAFMSCFFQDHAFIEKDMSNIKLRTVADRMRPLTEQMNIGQATKPMSVTALRIMRRMARECISEAWVIDPRFDAVIDLMAPDYGETIAHMSCGAKAPKKAKE